MKKRLLSIQVIAVLLSGSGCIVVPTRHGPVVYGPPIPRPVIVEAPRRVIPPPIVVVERPRPFVPPPIVVVERPRPVIEPPVVVFEEPRPVVPAPVVVIEEPRPVAPRVIVEQPRPHATHPPKVVTVKARERSSVQVIIEPQEREVIREYVVHKRSHDNRGEDNKHHGKPLPPGLAKKVERGGDLPPGWQKHCVRGQIMPAEIYKRCEPLPHEVAVKLPAPPPGTIIVTVEGKAVRLMEATLEILDVFDVL